MLISQTILLQMPLKMTLILTSFSLTWTAAMRDFTIMMVTYKCELLGIVTDLAAKGYERL